jgi:hypothetical protein
MCLFCEAGTHQDQNGRSECAPCPAGKFIGTLGARVRKGKKKKL